MGNNFAHTVRDKSRLEMAELCGFREVAASQSKMKDQSYTWTKDLISWQDKDGVSKYKIKAFSESVFVFTPKGEVIMLRKGSTPIDFAFSVHTGLGYRYHGAKVNGKIVSMDFELKTGDIVEIMSRKTINVTKDWLKHAKTSKARVGIRKFFRGEIDPA